MDERWSVAARLVKAKFTAVTRIEIATRKTLASEPRPGNMSQMIDLRSDTVTRPTRGMRRAMAGAQVGDDVYGEDPSVRALEAETARILGKAQAAYMPTGSMTNQVAIRLHTEPGDRVLMDADSHVVASEAGGPAALSGVTSERISGERGIFSAALLEDALEPLKGAPSALRPPARLLCLENTHNGGGGSVWPLERLEEVAGAARAAGLRAHLDGARLWNASAATGISPERYARCFDTVSVCFSKGLGAPVGSVLAGSERAIRRARRFKQLFGGGFRQAGIVAAGALYALRRHRERLCEDHENARALAEQLAGIPGIRIAPDEVETNIVRFDLAPGAPNAESLQSGCLRRGVLLVATGRRRIRAVTHMDVSREDVLQAARAISDCMAAPARSAQATE